MMDQPLRTLRALVISAALCAGTMVAAPAPATAQEPFIGEVVMFAGNFAPRGWAFCEGQLLPISNYQALFSILGTTYGGDGRTTFALPDLRGRVPLQPGNGPGLSSYRLGQKGGFEGVRLTQAQMPSHTHQIQGTDARGDQEAPGGAVPAKKNRDKDYKGGAPDVKMHPNMAAPAGGNQAHENRPPHLAINFIIALQGTYPSRN